ncbi:MAG: transcriptional repressor [Actinomycetota bacterium]
MSPQPSEIHELISARLRESGQLYTTGRRGLVELLLRSGRPVSIPDLLASDAGLTQSSLYRNLSALEGMGVVRRVVGVEELSRYELSVDIIGHHHHTICTECGVVEDFHLPTAAEDALRAALLAAQAESGFQPASHCVDLLGTCSGCVGSADSSVA